MASKSQILSIYKALLRESQKLTNYNFKSYAIRRIQDAFKENKALTDVKQIKKQYAVANENLAMLKRQTLIGDMYQTEKLVIENLQ